MKQFIFIELQQGLFSFNKNIHLTSRSISCKKNIPSTSMRKAMSCGTNIPIQRQHKSFSFKFKKEIFNLSQVLIQQNRHLLTPVSS